MHEYSLMQRVVEMILVGLDQPEGPHDGSVKEVILKVGALDVHSEESFRQAFEWLAKDTVLENARLHLVMIAPTLECPQCGYTGPCAADHAEGHDPMPVAECPGCGAVSGLHGARGVESIELVLSDEGG